LPSSWGCPGTCQSHPNPPPHTHPTPSSPCASRYYSRVYGCPGLYPPLFILWQLLIRRVGITKMLHTPAAGSASPTGTPRAVMCGGTAASAECGAVGTKKRKRTSSLDNGAVQAGGDRDWESEAPDSEPEGGLGSPTRSHDMMETPMSVPTGAVKTQRLTTRGVGGVTGRLPPTHPVAHGGHRAPAGDGAAQAVGHDGPGRGGNSSATMACGTLVPPAALAHREALRLAAAAVQAQAVQHELALQNQVGTIQRSLRRGRGMLFRTQALC
jgi:hypothetical protein